ncbi:hypothetical protein E3O19_12300 [Cryobacterium algoritolerans]|uniref:DUF4913 domain-containing protein n=1 Tax=Cryobacterium algoritolerans TaxID=1259184 RepID=A0A4R8WP84_9MICO|nr:hypothetical protein [Cryobacterium algoritolerans]TFC13246.1 hypothetical protein E3O19_12300 [Cryobacterium algoritolerans]
MSDDDELDPMRIEGLDARLVNVEKILPDVFDMYELRAPGGPYYWEALPHDQAVKLWNELGKFVAWRDSRYLTNLADPSYRLPGCWYRHPIAVEELTALMVAHRAAYDTRSAKASTALVDWHHRALWPTLDSLKLRAGMAGCRDRGEHREPRDGSKAFRMTEGYLRYGDMKS